MNTTLFQKKLSKISVIIDSLDQDGSINTLERDLILNYLRDLYDIVLDASGNLPTPQAKPTVKVSTPPPAVVQETIKVVETPVVEKVIEKPVVEAAKPISVEKVEEVVPATIEKIEEPKVAKPVVIDTPSPSVVNTPTPSISVKPTVSISGHEDAIEEMFAEEKVSDLSDRLANSAIKDLTKAMGINERVFTQTELFGGNAGEFNAILTKLNGLENLNQAKAYLIDEVIFKYDWVSDKKVKKAATFIKMVKRRYL
jgi:hypothetical protein